MNEAAYFNIVEHIRVGILLINEELQLMNGSSTIQQTTWLHNEPKRAT